MQNRNGGLTLVPMPGFLPLAEEVKKLIETGDFANKTLVDIAEPELGERASGEPFVKLSKEHVGGHDCVILTSGPGTYKMLLQLQLVLGYLVGRRAGRIALVSSYLPLARSDKDEGVKELALVAHIVHLIESAAYGHLDRIIAVDLHAEQETAVGSRMGLITPISMAHRVMSQALSAAAEQYPDRPLVLFLPDEGALKRFERQMIRVAQEFPSIHILNGNKRRFDSRNSKFAGVSGNTGLLRDAAVVAFDDEIATGGTNEHTATALKNDYGARFYWAAVIHGVFCGGAVDIFSKPAGAVDRIFTSDTIPVIGRDILGPLLESGKLTVVPFANKLASVLFNHHWDINFR